MEERMQTMKLTDKEINAILGKNQDVRYIYSLKRIADNDCLWILTSKQEKYFSFHNKGLNMLPIWPFKEYADNYISALDKEDGYTAVLLSIENFADELIDSLCENGMLICMFPVSEDDSGKTVSVNTFAEDLGKELENYK